MLRLVEGCADSPEPGGQEELSEETTKRCRPLLRVRHELKRGE